MTDLLFTRPANDSAAAQVATWGQALIHRIGPQSHADLAGAAASRVGVDRELTRGVKGLFHFGHGTPDAAIGVEALVDSANVSGVSGLLVAIACDCAIELGPEAVETHGVRAFLGFDDEVGFPGEAPLLMALAVVGGLECLFTEDHPIGCAADQLRQRLNAARLEYKHNGGAHGLSESESRVAWLFMKSNLHSLQVVGDPATTI